MLRKSKQTRVKSPFGYKNETEEVMFKENQKTCSLRGNTNGKKKKSWKA